MITDVAAITMYRLCMLVVWINVKTDEGWKEGEREGRELVDGEPGNHGMGERY
jgi:hypothetical protein